MAKPVTDPQLIAQLEALSAGSQPTKKPSAVVDPNIIKQLESGETEFSTGEMVQNIPSSALQFGKDIVQPFIHPIETAKSLGNLALGGIDKGAEALVNEVKDVFGDDTVKSINKFNNWLVDKGVPLERLPEDPEKMTFGNKIYAEAIGDFYKNRYGSFDQFKKTAMADPVGVLSDISAIATMGAGAAKSIPTLGLKGAIITNTAKALDKAQDIGKAFEPINIAGNTIRAASSALPSSLPGSLYERAAKFGTTMDPAKRKAITQTALDYKVMPSAAGLSSVNARISYLGQQIDGLIDFADKTGIEIPKSAVFKNLKELRRDMAGPKLFAAKNKKVIDSIAKQFDEHMKAIGKETLTPSELQAFKQDIYKHIDFDRSNLKASLPKEEAAKAIGRAAKDELEKISPDLKNLNAEQGRLLELKGPLEKTVSRIENRNLIPFGSPFNVAAGGAAGGIPGALGGAGASMMSLPSVQAKSGMILNDWQKLGLLNYLNNPTGSTMAHYGLFNLGRMENQ